MIEIRQLYPRDWEPTEPLVAYNKADRRVVIAAEMRRGNNSYYDRYGYKGSQDIVCIDCLEAGRDVPVSLVETEKKCIHFRHKAGEAPDGLGRHGETAEHLHGKQLMMDWAGYQRHIFPGSIDDEVWVPGVRLRSDVKAETFGGRQLAFEVQRKPMDRQDWGRRHGGYERAGVLDVWLWSPDVPHLVLGLPLTSVVLDMEYEEIGIMVADYAGRYRHPTAESRIIRPTHYAAASLTEWGLSAVGSLVPPPEMAEYIGDKPEPRRVAQLNDHRNPPAKPLGNPPQQQGASSGKYWSVTRSGWGQPGVGGRAPYIDPEREEQRRLDAIARIMSKKR
ncbi:competence protein CoiA family protein [Arthrobacter sp. 1P04PC]|uniref:competence protein CoiA family protein n=1 Tax=unclassified Arthrobacter TaxID=235627 RepID=UPI0039A2D093